MHAWWGLFSVDVHRGDRRRSSLLQMLASIGNCYYILFVKYVSRIPLQLIGHTYCSPPSPKKTICSLGGSILDQFIHISSTSTTCRTKSLIYKGKLAAGIRKTKITTTTMVQVHRRHSAMIHIAPALITRTRGLHRHPHPTTTNNGRLLWRRGNIICYVVTLLKRPYLIHMAHPCVCCLV